MMNGGGPIVLQLVRQQEDRRNNYRAGHVVHVHKSTLLRLDDARQFKAIIQGVQRCCINC